MSASIQSGRKNATQERREREPEPRAPASSGVEEIRPAPVPAEAPAPAKPRRAKKVLVGLLAAAAVLATGFYVHGIGRESTDDAQVEGRVMNVAARIPGQVLKVLVRDNQVVQEGEAVVELDSSDLEARLDAARADLAAAKAQELTAQAQLAITDRTAEANLKQAQGGLTQAVSAVSSSQSSIEQATADVAASDARFKLAQSELDRAKALVREGAIPGAQLDTAQTQFDAASAVLEQARARLESARANTTGSGGGVLLARGRLVQALTGPEQVQAARAALELAKAHVKQSEAALKLAELNVSFTKIRAPRRGQVSRRTVEVGQMVGPERPLMAIVPLDDIWVVANFKEDQMGEMRPGQRARISVDTFHGRVFEGHVDSIAGASGARFALLPPDNATGNFIKVVQRIPVLLRLDAPPGVELRPGMSAEVTVSTR